MVNEVPVEYFCTLDAAGRRIDQAERPELCSGSVEYIAPAEYMVGFSAVDNNSVGSGSMELTALANTWRPPGCSRQGSVRLRRV